MKKFIYLLLLLVPAFALVSCSDDDDVPNVTFDITFENAVEHDGNIYVVQGDIAEVQSITVTNNEAGKAAFITDAIFYWDGYYLGSSFQSPFTFKFGTTEQTPVGRHTLDITCALFAVDKSPSTAVVRYPVIIVASAEDIPDQAKPTARINPNVTANGK